MLARSPKRRARRQTTEDVLSYRASIFKYDIPGKLNGIGGKLHLSILQQFIEPKDIIEFLLTSHTISSVILKANIHPRDTVSAIVTSLGALADNQSSV